MIGDLLIEKHFKKIDIGYRNLILICIEREINLYDLVDKICNDIKNSKIEAKLKKSPECMRGFLLLSIISELLGTTLDDICKLSVAEKEQIIANIVKRVEGLKTSKTVFRDNESGDISNFISTFFIPNTYGDSDYELQFKRIFDGNKYLYSLEVCTSADKNKYEIEAFLADSVLVWEEYDGVLCNYIERTIKSMPGCSDDSEAFLEDDLLVEITDDDLEFYKCDDKKRKEELITSLGVPPILQTVFDQFDGVKQGKPVYRRMVLENAEYSVTLGMNVGVHLVIERYTGAYKCAGSILLSELRDHSNWNLVNYLKTVLDDEIISRYYEKDRFFRFEKPYGIRNNIRKKGDPSGKEFVWSTDENAYIDVRAFDCKVKYVIAGVYISAKHSKYTPDTRKHLE